MAGLAFGCDISLSTSLQVSGAQETGLVSGQVVSRLRKIPGWIQRRARPSRAPAQTVQNHCESNVERMYTTVEKPGRQPDHRRASPDLTSANVELMCLLKGDLEGRKTGLSLIASVRLCRQSLCCRSSRSGPSRYVHGMNRALVYHFFASRKSLREANLGTFASLRVAPATMV